MIDRQFSVKMRDKTVSAMERAKEELGESYSFIIREGVRSYLKEEGFLDGRTLKTEEVISLAHKVIENKDWTIDRFEQEASIGQGTLTRLFARKCTPSLMTVERIEKVLRQEYGCRNCQGLPIDDSWSGWWMPEGSEERANLCVKCAKEIIDHDIKSTDSI